MANTVTLLSYANTFGDWVVTTNKLIQENNDLAANNYVKSTGTLFLSSPTLGLQVANNAVVQGQLQVSGIGSSAYIQKNIQVDGSIIGASNNYFIANDANTILNITQSGSGLVLRINPQPGGMGTAGANSTVIDGNGNVYIGSAFAGPFKLNVANGNVNFSNNLIVGRTVNSPIIVGANNVIGDVVSGNTRVISPVVIGTTSVTSNFITANTQINTPTVVASSNVISGIISANTRVISPVVIGTTSVTSNLITANVLATTPELIVTSKIDANQAFIYADRTVSNTVVVQGTFFINGDTAYNSPTFTINSAEIIASNGSFINARGPLSNAEIKWNEINDWWELKDVNNPISYSKILTANLISDSTVLPSSNNIASSVTVNYLQNVSNTQNVWINNTNTFASMGAFTANQAWVGANTANGNIIALQSQMFTVNANVTATNSLTQAAFNRANNGVFNGTTGAATGSVGVISFSSNNGVTIYGSSNVLNISTSQDLRSTASPTFDSLTLTNPLAISQGGTGSTSAASALTALLPTGTTAGYILTTGGPGSFYWAAGGGGGGGGTTPGTTISSSRLSYIANGVTSAYTTPTYIPGAAQLRVYFDGVRQFAAGYTETSNTSVTFTTPVTSGINILFEVDGYINNPYYANNIAYTINSDISPTANSIQLAIDGLTSKLVTYYANTNGGTQTFTNVVLAPTPTINSPSGNTQIATTAFVNNKANSGVTFTASITGSAGSVANTGIVGLITNAQLAGPIGMTVTDDTSSSSTSYITFTQQTSGTSFSSNVSSTKLTFVPSTGTLSATIMTATSDKNLKENIVGISDALNTVMRLKGVEYNWKDTGEKGMGLVAQEVEEILPYLVSENENGKSVMYQNMIGLLVEAIKELKQEINTLKGDNK